MRIIDHRNRMLAILKDFMGKCFRCFSKGAADVLLPDVPIGHLDVDNIKWLDDWLESFTGSIICTSHFLPFLDNMRMHIIDHWSRKLKILKGIESNVCRKVSRGGLFHPQQ
jgi:hypothetical protein